MSKRNDLVGKKFNRLLVVEYHHTSSYGTKYYRCKCDCGNTTISCGYMVANGRIKSCGCLRKESLTKLITTHNLSKERLYNVWAKIKARCYNKNSHQYNNYGGRGIKMCNEWKNSFLSFYNWSMENGYNKNAPKGKCTIDRIDNNLDYEPFNCRWVDMKTQGNNRRTNKYAEYGGEVKTITEWAEHFGYNTAEFLRVYNKFNKIEDVLSYFEARGNSKRYNINSCKIIEYKGEQKPIKLWAKEFNVPYKLLFQRMNRLGWSLEKSLSTPIRKNHEIEYNGDILDLHTIARLNNIHPNSLKYQYTKNSNNIYKAIEHFKGDICKKNLSKA